MNPLRHQCPSLRWSVSIKVDSKARRALAVRGEQQAGSSDYQGGVSELVVLVVQKTYIYTDTYRVSTSLPTTSTINNQSSRKLTT